MKMATLVTKKLIIPNAIEPTFKRLNQEGPLRPLHRIRSDLNPEEKLVKSAFNVMDIEAHSSPVFGEVALRNSWQLSASD
jgi:hypothetical protein